MAALLALLRAPNEMGEVHVFSIIIHCCCGGEVVSRLGAEDDGVEMYSDRKVMGGGFPIGSPPLRPEV